MLQRSFFWVYSQREWNEYLKKGVCTLVFVVASFIKATMSNQKVNELVKCDMNICTHSFKDGISFSFQRMVDPCHLWGVMPWMGLENFIKKSVRDRKSNPSCCHLQAELKNIELTEKYKVQQWLSGTGRKGRMLIQSSYEGWMNSVNLIYSMVTILVM